MIAVVDYGLGNICSVENALRRLGVDYLLSADEKIIRAADRVLLPGVGNDAEAMANMRDRGLDKVIPMLTQPVLGICVGMQIMCLRSEEGQTECMGIFDTEVRRFVPVDGIKIPHMGWNRISNLSSPLLEGIDEDSFVYFVHSYRPELSAQAIAVAEHGGRFGAALRNGNFYGTQFHPEKSGGVGERILYNFVRL